MSKRDKFVQKLTAGKSDAGIDFGQLCELLRRLGFAEDTRGSHCTYTRDGITELINLQRDGRHAKRYQVGRCGRYW